MEASRVLKSVSPLRRKPAVRQAIPSPPRALSPLDLRRAQECLLARACVVYPRYGVEYESVAALGDTGHDQVTAGIGGHSGPVCPRRTLSGRKTASRHGGESVGGPSTPLGLWVFCPGKSSNT